MRLVVSGLWKLSGQAAQIVVSADDEAQARRYAEASGILVTEVHAVAAAPDPCRHQADPARRPHPLPTHQSTATPGSGIR